MANKEALRELQTRLADRLRAARTQERGKSWLA
ncbi:MAG: chemotaxis protein CheW, partial [Rhizobacter sp.]